MLSPVAGLRVEFDRIVKRFAGRSVLSGIGGRLDSGQVLVIAGPNGSGKSTLLNILAGLLRPSRGEVRYIGPAGQTIPRSGWFAHLGVAAPDMNCYDELTGLENLAFFARLRGCTRDSAALTALGERLGLAKRDQQRPVATYSSGMKQRLKLMQAVLHQPAVLLLDEPGSNLDADGHARIAELVAELRTGTAVAVATNDPREMVWGDERIELGL